MEGVYMRSKGTNIIGMVFILCASLAVSCATPEPYEVQTDYDGYYDYYDAGFYSSYDPYYNEEDDWFYDYYDTSYKDLDYNYDDDLYREELDYEYQPLEGEFDWEAE